jgi:ABC-type uncharacterized transport system involved in gliding motility auxiliary subunit
MKNFKKQFLTTFIIGAALLGGIAVALNMVLANFNFGRFDLTADQAYRISPSVGKILSKLDAPIEITYYVSSSEKMPTQWKNLERDVIDKLKDLQMASKGKLSYTVFDPSAEEEKEAFEEKKAEEKKEGEEDAKPKQPAKSAKRIAERLYEKGVIPFGVQSAERDEFAVKRVYSSLVLSYLDRKEDVIEEVRPETFGNLEYDIVSRIYKLISNRKPKIAFYPSQPEIPEEYRQYYRQAPPDMYEKAVELLKQEGYDVTRTNITKEDSIPGNIQTLVVMADQPLEERQLYEIDKKIHRGVRVILAGQMHNYQISPGKPGEFMLRGMPSGLNINDLTKSYGAELDNQMFMDKSTAYIQVPVYQTRNMGFMQVREQRMEPVTKPVLIRIQSENISRETSISNKISDIFYMYGTRLLTDDKRLEENKISKRVLFTSSNFSWTRSGYGYGPVDEALPPDGDRLKRQPLAVLLEGQFTPRFSQGKIPAWRSGEADTSSAAAEDSTELKGKSPENKLCILGCSNLFKSDMLESIASHRALLVNCVDALTLGDELINIRSKNITARRIKETNSAGKTASKFFVVWVPALAFIAAGIFINIRRKAK